MYYDYRYRFLKSNLETALQVMAALHDAEVMSAQSDMPLNMLGDPYDAHGEYCLPEDAVFYGREHGDYMYVAVRSKVSPEQLPNVAPFGFEPVSAEDSAAVLGVWA